MPHRLIISAIRNSSIKTKLIALTTLSVTVALVLSSAAFVTNDIRMIRISKIRQMSALADAVGQNTTAALDFNDAQTAAELLSSLGHQPSILFACLYDANGKLFASYPQTLPANVSAPPAPGENSTVFSQTGDLDVANVIFSRNEKAGSIFLRASMHELSDEYRHHAAIVLLVMTGTLALSLALSFRLQKVITEPLFRLLGVMKRVAADGDYSLRVPEGDRDEVGSLCEGFNDMLNQVESARIALEEANDQLEARVASRTAELETALHAAEAANRAKSDFLANMSHEIRTPMTAILGYADLLQDEDQTDNERREHVETIRRNGSHLLAVINDILDLSKIEAGKMTVERIACCPSEIIAEIASLVRPKLHSKKLSLRVEYRGTIPVSIQTDPMRLRQILNNVVGNAVKFTERGGVRIVVSVIEAADTSPARLAFEVIDTGVGMTPEQAQRLFKPFSQADESMTRRFGGTGLGLSISLRFAELLGGTIAIESELGKGSRFTVTVETGPLEGVHRVADCREALTPADFPAEQKAGGSLSGLRLLLVEDGEDNQRLISHVLTKQGAEVIVAENGQVGYDKALEADREGRPYHVILMDMQMPVLDGYSATRQLREAGYAGPIIAVTAHAMRNDRQRCLDVGCDDYTAKPIDRQKLVNLVLEYASGFVLSCRA